MDFIEMYMILSTKKFLLLVCLLTMTSWISAQDTDEITWYTLEEAVELSEKEPKKIFIDVITVWCGWCKKMEREVFSQDDIIKLLNEDYYAVRLDAQQKEDIEFEGETFEYQIYGQKGFNRFAVELLRGKMGFPSLVFLDEEFKIIQSLEGYQQTDRLELILSYFSADDYKRIHWSAYVKTYENQRMKHQINMNSLQQTGGKN